MLPSTLDSSKSVGMGYGEKKSIFNFKGLDAPPTGSYNLKGMYDEIKPH
jgi:hypothetical protein